MFLGWEETDWHSELWDKLKARIDLILLDDTYSTMQEARMHSASISPGLSPLIVSKRQSAGRGREDRVWSSPLGGLYFTLGYHFARNSNIAGLSLVVGLTIAEQIRDMGGQVYLKWPNDLVLADGKKLGGILIDALSDEKSTRTFIGVGVNLNRSPELPQDVANLSDLIKKDICIADFCGRMIQKLLFKFSIFEVSGFQSFVNPYLEMMAWRGEALEIRLAGDKKVFGKCKGVNSEGALELELESGEITRIYSGEVTRVRREERAK